MSKELETLKEMRAELDAKIDKLIKPEFEVGKWYKIKYESGTAIINYIEKHKSYGFSYNSNWSNDFDVYGYENPITYTEATPTEVQEALEKEYSKRGYERGKWIDLDRKDITNTCKEYKIVFEYDSVENKLWVQGCGVVFQNGAWAEIQKTMTIEELASEFDKKYRGSVFNLEAFFRQYLTENKSQIIETINSI